MNIIGLRSNKKIMKIKTVFLLKTLILLAIATVAQPPKAPKGYKWVKNEKFNDEFNGTELDKTKWYDRSLYWVNGRAPATFRARTVSVNDGFLQIKTIFYAKKTRKKTRHIQLLAGQLPR